jgi:hypothetical protein
MCFLTGRVRACLLSCTLLAPGIISAGTVILPTDISTTLTASPSNNLRPGQLIDFTMTVTNQGPAPFHGFVIRGPNIFNEFNPFVASNDCGLITAVVDLQTTSYYYFSWYFLAPPDGSDLAVGETRTCHFIEALTLHAPTVTPFSIGLPGYFVDPNPTNDRSTVYLVRALDPIPTLSPWVLLSLAGLLAAIARRQLRLHGVKRLAQRCFQS